MAHPARLERAACGFEVRRSIQLSYGCALYNLLTFLRVLDLRDLAFGEEFFGVTETVPPATYKVLRPRKDRLR